MFRSSVLRFASLTQCAAYSTAPAPVRVPLVYELHQPRDPSVRRDSALPPLLFLHGFLGSKRENREVCRMLANELSRDVYALDLRNHGSSPHHTPHTYADMAADVASFATTHELASPFRAVPPVVIGHSMGAKTALTLALSQPRLVSTVVAIDNGPGRWALGSEWDGYLDAIRMVDKARVKRFAEGDKMMAAYIKDPAIRLFLLSNFVRRGKALDLRIPVDVLHTNLQDMGDFPFDVGDDVRYDGPVLFLRSLKSGYVKDKDMSLIQRFFPNYTLKDFTCGHWIVQEQPQEMVDAVVDFLHDTS